MELETIGEVQQTDLVTEVNKQLQEGWVIIAIATGVGPDGEPRIVYSLGLPFEEDEDEDGEDEDEDEEDEES